MSFLLTDILHVVIDTVNFCYISRFVQNVTITIFGTTLSCNIRHINTVY